MAGSKRKGGCLCGAVGIDVTLNEESVHVCHCNICQKWHGGPGFSVQCGEAWSVTGEDNMTWYDSSEWAQRSFCSKCGTHLLFRTKDGSYHGVSAGALESQDGLEIGSHIFIDKKPSYFDFADKAPRLTEKEFLEMVGAAE